MRWWPRLLIAGFLIGCGDEPALPDIAAGVGASWPFMPASRDALGFTIYGVVLQRPQAPNGDCRALPASARITVDGQEITPLTLDESGCLDVSFSTGPLLDWANEPVTVRYEEGGKTIGEAVFTGLTPGVDATLVMPADGVVRPGDEILIVPPTALPTGYASSAQFFPLDPPAGAVWDAFGVPGRTMSTRLADGVHVTVPPMVGRAVVVMAGKPNVVYPDFTCDGFVACTGMGDNILGPVHVTVVEP